MPDESKPFYRGAKGNESLKQRSFFKSRPALPFDRSMLRLVGCDNRQRQDYTRIIALPMYFKFIKRLPCD